MRREMTAAAAAFVLGAGVLAFARTDRAPPEGRTAQRVISLAPSLTETVFALGGGERVVGVSAGVTWPPEALEVERVGGYMDADLERIVGLRPDVILVQGIHAYVHDQAAELGIPVRRIAMRGLDDIRRAVREIGGVIEMPDAADRLVRRIDSDLESVRERTRSRRPLRTFLHIAHGVARPAPPFLTAGRGTFLSEVLEIAGGRNVYSTSSRPYLDVSTESLIERAPEVVMVSLPGVDLSDRDGETVRAAWRRILPVRPGRPAARVVFLTADCAQVPGPRVGLLAREMEGLLWTRKDAGAGRGGVR